MVVVIFTSQQTTFVWRFILLMRRSKHGWFDEREACTKKFQCHWCHGPNTTISRGGGGGVGCRIQGSGPAAPPPRGQVWVHPPELLREGGSFHVRIPPPQLPGTPRESLLIRKDL